MSDSPDAQWDARDRLRDRLKHKPDSVELVEVPPEDLRIVLDAATWIAPDGGLYTPATHALAIMQRMLRDQEPADARRIVTWLADQYDGDDDA